METEKDSAGMSADRELLDLAARAHGNLKRVEGCGWLHILADGSSGAWWEPQHCDDDAFRLAAKLGMKVDFNFRTSKDERAGVAVWLPNGQSAYPPFWTANARDICVAARQTIVRAAAEIGKMSQSK
jgi:hypothetical protein